MSSETKIPASDEVTVEAMEELLRKLGPAKTALFIRDHLSRRTDYLEIKERLFGAATVEDLSEQIRRSKGGEMKK